MDLPANAGETGKLSRIARRSPSDGAAAMNPANFPNVGGGMPGGANPHGQTQMPQRNENASVIMNQVAQALQAQGPFSGWRAEVPIKDRAVKVYQM